MPETPSEDYTLRVETRSLLEVARNEIAVARASGDTPLDLADSHLRLGYIIRRLIAQEGSERGTNANA